MPFLPCAWSHAPVCRFHKWWILRRPSSRPLAVARPNHSARYISRECVSYLTLGRESRAAPSRKFSRPIFHLVVEQLDRGDVLMGSGIEIGGHPATTKRGQRRTEDLSAFKIAPPETAIEGGLVI